MSRLFLMFEIRYLPLVMSIVLSAAFAVALAVHPNFVWLWIGFPAGLAYGAAAYLIGSSTAGDLLDKRAPEVLAAVMPNR